MVRFARESVCDLWDEIGPLLYEHWEEIAHYKDIPLNLNVEAYERLEREGVFRVYTARNEEGKLIGYAAYMVRYNLHYSDSKQAMQDVLFVTKNERHKLVGYNLIKYADEQLRQEGVQVVYQHVKLKHDFGPLLSRIGYEPVEMIWARRLD